MKHKHAELIKAWADGAEIQVKTDDGTWCDIGGFMDWYKEYEYRIKPEPKSDLTLYFLADKCLWSEFPKVIRCQLNNLPNLKMVWDGETGELKNAEVIK